MSMFESLLRFVDVIAYRKKQEERRVKRKAQPPGVDDDEDIALPRRSNGRAPPERALSRGDAAIRGPPSTAIRATPPRARAHDRVARGGRGAPATHGGHA